MAQTNAQTGEAAQSGYCDSAKVLLKQVNDQLASFKALKLDELQTELDQFCKKQETVVNEYRTRYPALRKTWCDRQTDVERLCAHIKCEFPLDKEPWKTLIADKICGPLHDICCLEKRIAKRKRCCSGPLQRARDEALAVSDAAKKRLDWLTNLSARLDGLLTDEMKLVGDIEKLPPADRTAALYLFWFKLLPAHKRMAPDDVSDACKKLCAEGDPQTLCSEVFGKDCEDLDDGCAPKAAGQAGQVAQTGQAAQAAQAAPAAAPGATAGKTPPATEGCKPVEPRGPWLMSPDSYETELDCAWAAYHEAKMKLADAESKLKADPDDLDSLIKQLTASKDPKTLDDAITKELKKVKPQDNCCNGAAAAKNGGK